MIRIIHFLCLLTFPISSAIFAQTIYVATDGNDNNSGAINSPYKTFNKAISTMTAGGTCIIKGGVYEEEFIINTSGTSGNYITFKAANGEEVEIRATSSISGWQLHTGTIYKANVNMTIDSKLQAVYHNNNYMDLARWPNNSDANRWTLNTVPVTGGSASNFLADDIPNIDWTGGMVYYLGAHSGTSWTRSITNSTNTSIEHAGVNINSWPFTPHNPTVWRDNPNNNRGQIYLFNKLEALDYANEWYQDNITNTLYFQPSDGNKPIDGEVTYTKHAYAAQLNGNYIKLEGINFFGGSVKINGNHAIFINNKITHGVEGHDDLNNTSASVGRAAIEILGESTLVKNCTLNHSATSGISIQNWAGAHNTTIEANTIKNTDYLGIHATPIRSSANNVTIVKNTILNAGRDGIYVSGQNCEVAYNDVSYAELINSDSGVFYTVGNSTLKNTEIHHNWLHDSTAPNYSHKIGEPAKAAGIYLDNNSKGYTVHHNVVWNVSWSGIQVNWNNTNLDFYHNSFWNAERAMDSWVNGYDQENNKIYNNFANTGSWFAGNGSSEFDIQNNLISASSPFTDANNQNFYPEENSTIVDQAKIISGFEKSFMGNAPDIGAYEYGGTKWTAGINAVRDTGAPLPNNPNYGYAQNFETAPSEEVPANDDLIVDYDNDYVIGNNGPAASEKQLGSWAENPFKTDLNSSNNALKITEEVGGKAWAYPALLFGTRGFTMNASEGKHLLIKFLATNKTDFSFTIIPWIGGTASTGITKNFSGLNSNTWYQTSFDFTEASDGYIARLDLKFDNNEGVYFVDDFIQSTTGILTVENVNRKRIAVFPNPTNNYLSISGDDSIQSVVIFNKVGKKLFTFNNHQNMDVSSLSPGIYLLKTDNGTTFKFIKY
ncbi:right-handed parallel beta-helix repeat-containing protein [Flavicella sediminum]|uniref:right-handed parallel beta-helix repeat-containing protein n=1 Tax=Flavicella sediminum TaxID=2585141 RepID=UPI0011245645|nr:T9SS type A sorting domain-containing protein [Flavicella sediminum]